MSDGLLDQIEAAADEAQNRPAHLRREVKRPVERPYPTNECKMQKQVRDCYAVSVMASRRVGDQLVNHHGCGWVYALSEDEAYGKAHRANLREHPPEDGWNYHHTVVGKIGPDE